LSQDSSVSEMTEYKQDDQSLVLTWTGTFLFVTTPKLSVKFTQLPA